MGGFGRMIAFLVAVAIAIGLGAAVYNAGVQAGLAEAVRLGTISPDAPVIIGGWWHGGFWGPGFGFGPFGFLFGLLAIFLVFGLLRAAFFGGRHHGPRGWGGGPGGWGGGPGGWGGDRREHLAELHREMHRRDADASQPAPGSSAGA